MGDLENAEMKKTGFRLEDEVEAKVVRLCAEMRACAADDESDKPKNLLDQTWELLHRAGAFGYFAKCAARDTQNDTHASDLMQMFQEQVYKSLHGFRGGGSSGWVSWARTVYHRALSNLIKDKEPFIDIIDGSGDVEPSRVDGIAVSAAARRLMDENKTQAGLATLIEREMKQALYTRAITYIPVNRRLAFHFHCDGASWDEIRHNLGLWPPPSRPTSRRFRGALLRELRRVQEETCLAGARLPSDLPGNGRLGRPGQAV